MHNTLYTFSATATQMHMLLVLKATGTVPTAFHTQRAAIRQLIDLGFVSRTDRDSLKLTDLGERFIAVS